VMGVHLVQIPVRLRAFTKWGLRRKLLSAPPADHRGSPREPDPGYALHAALRGLLGRHAPRPFCLLSARARRPFTPLGAAPYTAPLLGYARLDAESLRAIVEFTNQEIRDLFAWRHIKTRLLPANLPTGLRLGFDLRACPVRRRTKSLPFVTNGSNRAKSVAFRGPGVEMDAYQLESARAEQRGDRIPRRETVYVRWLSERFSTPRRGTPPLVLLEESLRVQSYRSARLLRRPIKGSGRSRRWLTRPEVWFRGELEVRHSERIPDFLTRGIGRHCGFGFGMMLLRPA